MRRREEETETENIKDREDKCPILTATYKGIFYKSQAIQRQEHVHILKSRGKLLTNARKNNW